MTDRDAVAAALTELADGQDGDAASGPAGTDEMDYRQVIARAAAATDDVEAAAQFRSEVGLDRLREAIERADREVSECAEAGREALAAFEAFQAAAT